MILSAIAQDRFSLLGGCGAGRLSRPPVLIPLGVIALISECIATAVTVMVATAFALGAMAQLHPSMMIRCFD
jgi:hypothetical protein